MTNTRINLYRKRYHDTPSAQRLDRTQAADEVLALLKKTVAIASDDNKRSRSKRLILIEGDAGIGKSWFIEYLQERIRNDEKCKTWRLAPFYGNGDEGFRYEDQAAYQADTFVAMDTYPYARFLEVLHRCDRLLEINCLGDLPDPPTVTVEDVARWANTFEAALTERRNIPLLLFFDELEWWVGIEGPQRVLLDHLFRIVWQMLLKHAQLPCIIICASRRPPIFSNPLLRLVLQPYKLEEFPSAELTKLARDDLPPVLLAYLREHASGNPWLVQLLVAFAQEPTAWQDGQLTPDVRWQIFQRIIDNRLDEKLQQTLYILAEQRPDGFTPEDELLPESHMTVSQLQNASFVDFNEKKRRYVVATILANLFKAIKE